MSDRIIELPEHERMHHDVRDEIDIKKGRARVTLMILEQGRVWVEVVSPRWIHLRAEYISSVRCQRKYLQSIC